MSKPARVAEPSMEEILASIRRIIADDSNAQPRAASKPDAETDQPVNTVLAPSEDASPAEADVLELTQPVEAGPAFKAVRGSDVMFREEQRRAPEPAITAPATAQAAAPQEHTMRDQDLLSPSSTAAVSAAFNALAGTVLTEHARSLEDIVREMLRPMLKQWLEENLPGLVERLVRAEIDRVSRGGR
jgi:cell pole-organizing protein PopZ